MSNCDFVAAKSLIDLAASKLALRAPALRAATALTRPNRPCFGATAIPVAGCSSPGRPPLRGQALFSAYSLAA
jgi:hypothetical protein